MAVVCLCLLRYYIVEFKSVSDDYPDVFISFFFLFFLSSAFLHTMQTFPSESAGIQFVAFLMPQTAAQPSSAWRFHLSAQHLRGCSCHEITYPSSSKLPDCNQDVWFPRSTAPVSKDLLRYSFTWVVTANLVIRCRKNYSASLIQTVLLNLFPFFFFSFLRLLKRHSW